TTVAINNPVTNVKIFFMVIQFKMGYSNRRVYCGTICFYYPVNWYNSKPMPVCQNGLKEMLRTSLLII
ncbi:MAG: hypothetical protein WBO38_13315, partial [Chitinophagaceae bacterium]